MKPILVLRILTLVAASLLTANALLIAMRMEDLFSQLISGASVGTTHQTFLVVITMGLLIARLVLQRKHLSTVQFAMIFFALVCLVEEWIMFKLGSLPISQIISSWASEPLPNNWLELKHQWRLMVYWRSALIACSFLLILGCDSFKKKSLLFPSVAAAA